MYLSIIAIAFYGDNKFNNDRTILVHDFGGGSTESSIVNVHNNMFCVKFMSGESNLGGENINNNMLDYFLKCFHEKYQNNDTLLPRPLMPLRKSCIATKKELTKAEDASINCHSFHNNQDFKERFHVQSLKKLMKIYLNLQRIQSDKF